MYRKVCLDTEQSREVTRQLVDKLIPFTFAPLQYSFDHAHSVDVVAVSDRDAARLGWVK